MFCQLLLKYRNQTNAFVNSKCKGATIVNTIDKTPFSKHNTSRAKTVTNYAINLDSESVWRIEASNILNYTFLLDYCSENGIESNFNELTDTTKTSIINEVITQCQCACNRIFLDDTHPYHDFYYNFFGFHPISISPYLNSKLKINVSQKQDKNKKKQDNYKPTQDDYFYLFREIGMIPSESDERHKPFSKPFLHNLIIQHCIISCYHAVMTEINALNHINNLQIDRPYILDTLMGCASKKNESNTSSVSTKSNLKVTFEKHENSIPFFDIDMAALTMPETVLKLCQVHSSHFTSVFYPYSISKKESKGKQTKGKQVEHTKITKLNNILKLSSELYPRHEKRKKLTVNDIYQNYLIERIFDFRLFYSMLNAILYINEQTKYNLSDPLILNNLCACKLLPNTLSRQAMLWYAVLHISDDTYTRYNYWNNMNDDPFSPTSAGQYTDYSTPFDFFEWSRQFRLFCQYMADFIIPVYEWCFTDILFKEIENATKSKTSFGHKDRLITAKKILEEFIADNIDIMISPISLGEEHFITKDMIDTFTPFAEPVNEDTIKFSILQNTPNNPFMTIHKINDDAFNFLFRQFTDHNISTNLGISEKLTREHIKSIFCNVAVTNRDVFYRRFYNNPM